MRAKDDLQTTTSRKAFKRLYKLVTCNEDGRCTICPWHKGENLTKFRTHGTRKPKYKDHK